MPGPSFAPTFFAPSPAGTAPIRYRFYPAQLRRLLTVDLAALTAGRNHNLTWTGWDRSLPRLYLPVDPLMRLILEAVDGITRQTEPSQASTTAINLQVQPPRGGEPLLELAVSSRHWQAADKFRGALNARWFRSGSQAHLWQRLARHADSIGGWLSVRSLIGGGTSLIISLPIDKPIALVHNWMTRRAAVSSPFTSGSHDAQLRLCLFAIGRSQTESVEQLQAANVRLQSLARSSDYIYRVSHRRWLWLSTEAELPAFMQTSAWQSEVLDRWISGTGTPGLVDLASRVDERMRQLASMHVPPIDLITARASRGPITSRRPHTRVDHALTRARRTHLHVAGENKAKWRYPI